MRIHLRALRDSRYETKAFYLLHSNRTIRGKRPQSNGIIERFHRTLLDEHFRVEGRRTWFETIEDTQAVLEDFFTGYKSATAAPGPQRERAHASHSIRR